MHGIRRKGVIDFKKQAIIYCKTDVNILLTGCVKFREELICVSGVDPFSRITIASTCMKVYVSNFFLPNSIAIPAQDDPEIIYKDFEAPENNFGLIRAVVVPPRGLYIPLLPHKTSKLGSWCLLSVIQAPK